MPMLGLCALDARDHLYHGGMDQLNIDGGVVCREVLCVGTQERPQRVTSRWQGSLGLSMHGSSKLPMFEASN